MGSCARHTNKFEGQELMGQSMQNRFSSFSSLDNDVIMNFTVFTGTFRIMLNDLPFLPSGFSVIWAQKSILILTENIHLNKTTELLDSYTQQEYWNQWSKHIHHTVKRNIDFNQIPLQLNKQSKCNNHYDNCQSSLSTIHYTKPIYEQYKNVYRNKRHLYTTVNCPEKEIIKLENRLLSEMRKDLQQPSIDFIKHLKEAGVGQLDEIQIERLGPCIQTQRNYDWFFLCL
ncbi:uncharacterized protein DC041_0003718 [Schistosoma bovis]|uniref:Uncharacterized protein n=1 Tax=Schistosoma bovis TaxID=6184 RepID=A0A430QF53_SCHBO|nr:uncharacterized protein DC041_0003718 [Schistosoma bovis]